MIVKAVLAIVNSITQFIFSIFPDIPVFPPVIINSINFMTSYMVNGAGIIKFFLGGTLYNAFLDYVILMYGYKMFITVFRFIKNYILMK